MRWAEIPREGVGRELLVRKSLLLALVSTLLTLFLGEMIVRQIYPELPSLAPLEASDMKVKYFQWSDYPPMKDRRDLSATCRESSYLIKKDGTSEKRYGPEEGQALKLWVAGDSVTMGFGVEAGSDYGNLLGKRLVEATGLPVIVRNLGINGAGFCGVLKRLNENVGVDGAPDIVVIGLFADDLEERALVSAQEKLVAFPDRVENPLGRLLVSQSYMANLGWYAFMAQRSQQTDTKRYIDEKGQALFKDSMSHMAQLLDKNRTAMITALLAPAGLHLCAEDPEENSRCRWLGPDLDLMANLLDELKIPTVNLKDVWKDKPTMVISEELDRMNRGLELGVHPDERGHAVLADALWPAVEAALINRLAQ